MAGRKWVAVTATEDFPVDLKPVKAALKNIAPVRVVPLPFRPISEKEESRFASMLQGAVGILVRPGYITASLLDQLPDLKIVAVHGAGVDQVDVDACTARGVRVTNTPGSNADAVAELTLGFMLSMARKIGPADRKVQSQKVWGEARHTGFELKGRTLGLIGIGQIATRVARLANAFGMNVLATDPGVPATEIKSRGARPVSLETIYKQSDIVSLHAPSIPQTHHMINRKAISQMKKGAYIINCARGPLIDEAALIKALQSGRLGGAALDVLEGEPPNPDSPIFDAPNVIITPHMGGSTVECLATTAAWASVDIARVVQGKRPRRPVNKLR